MPSRRFATSTTRYKNKKALRLQRLKLFFLILQCRLKNRITTKNSSNLCVYLNLQGCSSSPRTISIAKLNTLLYLHLRPIKLVVYKCPYSLEGMGYLILRCASCLDAFSVYHIRTRLLCYALGRTTDAPEVRPTRSSRTKVSPSQISNAHDR